MSVEKEKYEYERRACGCGNVMKTDVDMILDRISKLNFKFCNLFPGYRAEYTFTRVFNLYVIRSH